MTASASLADILRAFPPSRIYALATKPALEEGFRRLAGEPVLDVLPVDDGSGAMVEFQGRTLSLFPENGKLGHRCTCGNDASLSGCRHFVAAVVTLKKLVDPHAFPTVRLSPDYRRFLEGRLGPEFSSPLPTDPKEVRRGLLSLLEEGRRKRAEIRKIAASTTPSAPSAAGYLLIVIERHEGGTHGIHLRKGARRIASGWAPEVPAPLLPLASPYHSPEAGLKILRRLLAEGAVRWPILYRDGDREIPLRPGGGDSCRTRTFVDVSEGEVSVRHGIDDAGELRAWRMIGEGIAVDPEAGMILATPEDDGHRAWSLFEEAVDPLDIDSDPDAPDEAVAFGLTADAFHHQAPAVPASFLDRFRKAVRVTVEGKEVPIVVAGPQAGPDVPDVARLLEAHSGEGPEGNLLFLLRAIRAVGDVCLFPDPEPFRILDLHALPPHLRSGKRRDAVCRAFFAGLSGETPSARQAAVERELAPVLGDRHDLGDHVAFVLHFVKQGRENPYRLLLPEDGTPALLVPSDRVRQAEPLRILFERFGSRIFDGTSGTIEMILPQEDFQAALPVLHAELARAGIDLRIDGQPLAPATWEIRIDAERSRIDWFEIRPEVRWEGEPIPEDIWRQVAEGSGCVRRGDGLFLIDPETLAAIRILAGLSPAAGRTPKSAGRKGERRPREIVRMPRLRMLDLMLLRRRGVDLRLPEEDERIFRRLLSLDRIEERPVPVTLSARLRSYQREGYAWLSFLCENRFGACLADDMGLGKTVQTIALFAALSEGLVDSGAPPGLPHLVVAPPSLLFNWENEIRRFLPGATVVTYRGKDRSADFSGADIVLASYDIVRRDIGKLSGIAFHGIVFDEAQAVKNLHAGATAAARQLKGHFRLALTGTPLENHVGEYFSIMDLVLPGLLGEYDDIRARLRKEDPDTIETLRRRSRPFLLRRTKERVLAELPPKVETDVHLELTDRQRALYHRTAAEMRRTVEAAYAEKTEHQARIIALTALLRLRQVCLSPELLVPEQREASPKIAFLIDRLRELEESGHSALVFSQFTSFLDLVERELREAGLDHFRLDGSTPVPERKKLVEAFQSRETPASFLLSLKAGGKGLNLTRATYVFHLDPWWNPAVEDQASDRAHRIGQGRKVTVTRLLMRHTLEEKIMLLKGRKQRLFRAILGEAEESGASAISRADFEFLLATE